MLKIACIDHIVLRTSNKKKMVDFYCGILGCSIERETSPEIGLTQLRAGSALIDLVIVESQLGSLGGGRPTKTENNVDHFCLQLQPITEGEIRSFLELKGVVVDEFYIRYGAQGDGPSMYIHDPDGNTVELRSQLSDAQQTV